MTWLNITGKTRVGERYEKRPNGDIYVYERITAYNEAKKYFGYFTHRLREKIKGDYL